LFQQFFRHFGVINTCTREYFHFNPPTRIYCHAFSGSRCNSPVPHTILVLWFLIFWLSFGFLVTRQDFIFGFVLCLFFRHTQNSPHFDIHATTPKALWRLP